MRIRHSRDIPSSEITPKPVFLDRRRFLGAAGAILALATFGKTGGALAEAWPKRPRSPFSTDEKPTSKEDVTHYNNFYEYGTDKGDPSVNAPGHLRTRPWTIAVGGECMAPGAIDVYDLISRSALEDRIFRHRCVEGWSMVIPWVGMSLGPVLERFKPTSRAKFVAFKTLMDPDQMPGERLELFDWPYSEGLRMDEAFHPLATLAVGLYGESLLNQNGAPIRLVVPWKYGFKSIKSIVSITFVEQQPKTLWNTFAPGEYGFYSNVNPTVDHPRWSQARERRIGEFFRRPTLMFNGYGDQVAPLYRGMDLARDF